MTSQNNPIGSQQGSALIVTILLVSVLLVTALILLQRIIPYAKSVRSMHDASQAYYVARGQVDLARLGFLYTGGGSSTGFRIPSLFRLISETPSATSIQSAELRENKVGGWQITSSSNPQTLTNNVLKELGSDGAKVLVLGSAFMTLGDTPVKTDKHESYAVASSMRELPLRIRLFPTDGDTSIKNFGTSKVNSLYHTLYSRNSGGLRFDLRGVKLSTATLRIQPTGTIPPTGNIVIKIQYLKSINDVMQTFTAEYPLNLLTSDIPYDLIGSPVTGNIQLITNTGSVFSISGATLSNFLKKLGPASIPPTGVSTSDIDCSSAKICSLTLTLNSTTNQSIDFQLISDKQIPDLNAVVVGDGLSGNGLYYQRIIDLIPTPQDI